LSRIEVPSAPFGAQDLEGSAPRAYTLKNKRHGCSSVLKSVVRGENASIVKKEFNEKA